MQYILNTNHNRKNHELIESKLQHTFITFVGGARFGRSKSRNEKFNQGTFYIKNLYKTIIKCTAGFRVKIIYGQL